MDICFKLASEKIINGATLDSFATFILKSFKRVNKFSSTLVSIVDSLDLVTKGLFSDLFNFNLVETLAPLNKTSFDIGVSIKTGYLSPILLIYPSVIK